MPPEIFITDNCHSHEVSRKLVCFKIFGVWVKVPVTWHFVDNFSDSICGVTVKVGLSPSRDTRVLKQDHYCYVLWMGRKVDGLVCCVKHAGMLFFLLKSDFWFYKSLKNQQKCDYIVNSLKSALKPLPCVHVGHLLYSIKLAYLFPKCHPEYL